MSRLRYQSKGEMKTRRKGMKDKEGRAHYTQQSQSKTKHRAPVHWIADYEAQLIVKSN